MKELGEYYGGKAPHMGPYIPSSECVCPMCDVSYGVRMVHLGGGCAVALLKPQW